MAFDLTITLSSILTVVGMILGALGLIITLRVMLKEFGMRLTSLEKSSTQQNAEISELRKLVIQMAVQTERLNGQNERMNSLDRRLEDLSHGRGFVREAFSGIRKDMAGT